ncbi:NAD(P)-dependent alcohol dehydrogenase [Aspergillus affinis]|uniref:NAD(P)-dependent alcohol dehydrogenase n=1 Tax=Aspergillus affinis TaxID=1070780 RepID=UPI0022FDE947|nr:alcohol dehydrogenase [Aspergillus affinis]KAI9040771.1 alcohol dehydrogenase [Aspergillus affinis]
MTNITITPTTARAIVSYGPYSAGGWKLEPVTLRPLQQGELLVEIIASGICQTDLHFAGMQSGYGVHYPRVMGHEGAGYVRQVGAGVTVARINDPVLLSFASCQSCACCRRGHPAHCESYDPINFEARSRNRVFSATEDTGPTIYGQFFGQSSFASFTIVREESVVNMAGLVETKDDLRMLAPLGCGVQTGAGAVIRAAAAEPEDTVAVLGLGGVGLSAVMGARIAGCKRVIGIARNETRLKAALDCGATHVIKINPGEGSEAITAAVRGLNGGKGADVVLETTGAVALVGEAVRMAGNKGRIVQLGVAPEGSVVELPIHEMMVSGKVFMGVVEGDVVSQEFVPRMAKWVKTGALPLEKMVRFYPAEEYEVAIRDMLAGKTTKPVIVW